jgi:hypothetical protein
MTVSKTIREQIRGYDIPETVKLKALEIYDILENFVGTCRSSVRNQLLYFLIHNAYVELGEPPIQTEIIKMVNIDPSSISKALKLFSFPRTPYHVGMDTTTVQVLIPHHARVLAMREDVIQDMVKESAKWSENPELKRKPTIVVTAAVLKYYMDIHGYAIEWSQITEQFKRTKIVIEEAYKIISRIDNN